MVAAFSPAASAVDKPNILLIFADDQAFDTIHAHGNSEIQTPNLDRLSARATTFTHAYNMGSWSGAVCVASRMMMISGKYLWHAQKDHAKTTQLYQEKGRMWPQLLEASGYDTYFTGKWHIRADAAKTFKVAANVRGGMPNQTEAGYNRPIEGQTLIEMEAVDKSFGGFWKGGKHWSEVVGDDASGFIKTAKKSDSPSSCTSPLMLRTILVSHPGSTSISTRSTTSRCQPALSRNIRSTKR